MAKRKILITGGNGLVMSRFIELYKDKYDLLNICIDPHPNIDVKTKIVDILNKDELNSVISEFNPDILIHAAAFTNVNKAEEDRDLERNSLAWKINVEGTNNILKSIESTETHLIYISTDFVFDGENGPYREEDITCKDKKKISWYGWTKLEGERAIEKSSLNYTLIRISYPFGKRFEGKLDYLNKLVELYNNNSLYPLFIDQYITPTYIDDFAKGAEIIIAKNLYGIYHIGSSNITTPYEFAIDTLNKYNVEKSFIKRASIIDYLKDKGKTRIPINGGLISNKIIKEGLDIHSTKAAINEILF